MYLLVDTFGNRPDRIHRKDGVIDRAREVMLVGDGRVGEGTTAVHRKVETATSPTVAVHLKHEIERGTIATVVHLQPPTIPVGVAVEENAPVVLALGAGDRRSGGRRDGSYQGGEGGRTHGWYYY